MVKLSINNHIVGLLIVHKKHIMRTCLMHAACKVEFQPFKRMYSQLTFFNLKKKVTANIDVLKYFYELLLYRSYSQLTFTIQTVVLTADVFQLKKYILSEEVEKRQL